MANSKILLVTLLDGSVMQFVVTRKTFGRDILDQVCQSLGVWEQDYFSLQYDNLRGEKRWLNNKNPLLPQLLEENITADTFKCMFRVKFFVQQQQILMTLTRHLFYLDLKKKLKDQTLRIPPHHQRKIKILSCLAQAELGDFQPDCDLEMLYRTVVPGYTESLFEDLKKNHSMLRLTSKQEAEVLFLTKISQVVEEYGTDRHEVYAHGRSVMSMNICMEGATIIIKEQPDRRIPFCNFISARVNNNNLHMIVEDFPYKQLIPEMDQINIEAPIGLNMEYNTLTDVSLQFLTADQCWHAYRALTERIVFYARNRADDIEEPHFKCRWHSFVAKVQPSKATALRLYNFDVEHTSKETYENTWNILVTDVGERNASNKRVTCSIPHISCLPRGLLRRRGQSEP
ncbi:Myosin regulatory light chain interacting protein L homeolog [Oopsacas minuta]|uniref:Myosin regulatory light chain interacting protein L homeolog n=1 Tax=Oopsacas minuta TaxID=111878 RepID=A0AAV7KIB7_9METZ|nr:Myosin regulatory light chain interacting protein L homeolog [Oopsacas minuta]